MRLVKRNFNNANDFFPTFWNNLFADDTSIKRSLDRQKARHQNIQRWFNHNNIAVNIKNVDNAFVIELAAPGYKKEDFKVSFEDNRLLVSAELKTEETTNEEGTNQFTHKEFNYSSFQRSFNMPEDGVDIDGIKATYEAGILTVNIPKQEIEDNTRHINVQ
ncbi:MAG: Hsp20/alpha crystallin family protein [Aureispira sp.]